MKKKQKMVKLFKAEMRVLKEDIVRLEKRILDLQSEVFNKRLEISRIKIREKERELGGDE